MSQRDRLLEALQDAGRSGLTSLEITRLGILRGGARLMELRDAGHVISTERFFSGNSTLFRYTLDSEPGAGRERTVITAPAAPGCETTLFADDVPPSTTRSAITGKAL